MQHEATGDERKKRQKSVHTNSKHNQKSKRQTKTITRRDTIMMQKMYSVKDELNGFTPAIPFPSDEVAKRYFREMKEGNFTIKTTPGDFSIWYLGEFNTETGETSNQITLLERG